MRQRWLAALRNPAALVRGLTPQQRREDPAALVRKLVEETRLAEADAAQAAKEEELRRRRERDAQARLNRIRDEAADAEAMRRKEERRALQARIDAAAARAANPRRGFVTSAGRAGAVVRKKTHDYDLAVGQRVQYLSESQQRWVRATVTKLNKDGSVNMRGDDNITRFNYHVMFDE